jgi:hypothetical protein
LHRASARVAFRLRCLRKQLPTRRIAAAHGNPARIEPPAAAAPPPPPSQPRPQLGGDQPGWAGLAAETVNGIIGTLNGITGTLNGITGTLNGITGTLNGIIGTL